MSKLILSRRTGEKIMINDDIIVQVCGINGNTVRLSIVAPREVEVHRSEIWDKIQLEKGNTNGD